MVEHGCFFSFHYLQWNNRSRYLRKQLRNVNNWRDYANQAIGRVSLRSYLLQERSSLLSCFCLCFNTFREYQSVARYYFLGPGCSKRQDNRNVNPRLKVEQGFHSHKWKCFSLQMLCRVSQVKTGHQKLQV